MVVGPSYPNPSSGKGGNKRMKTKTKRKMASRKKRKLVSIRNQMENILFVDKMVFGRRIALITQLREREVKTMLYLLSHA